MPQRVPIARAKEVAEKAKLKQVVLIGLDESGRQHCVTYGVTQKDCAQAAEGGIFWNKIIRLDDLQTQQQVRNMLNGDLPTT